MILITLVFILGGVFFNSSYVSSKQDEAYASLKEKYGVMPTPVTEVEEILPDNTVEDEQPQVQVEPEPQVTEIVEEPKVDNRTTENIIWDFLKVNGYTDIQAAAIIGNLYQESGLNPSRTEYGTGEGIGLVQWSFGRKQQLKDFCFAKGANWTDLNSQLEFLVKELNSSQFHKKHKTTFNNPYSIDEATEAFCWGFERPNANKANMEYRKKMAWQAYYRNVNR